MKRNVCLSAAILCITSACAAVTGHNASKTITVTGCVQNKGAMSSATMDGGYMLTNTVTGNAAGARPSSPGSIGPTPHDDAPGADGTGSSGTAAQNPSDASSASNDKEMAHHRSPSYMLDGRDSELRNYIDKRVEITGTLETHVDVAGDSNAIPTRGSVVPHGRNTGLQWLRVASAKVISSGCSAKSSD